jgi:hypothetical protein
MSKATAADRTIGRLVNSAAAARTHAASVAFASAFSVLAMTLDRLPPSPDRDAMLARVRPALGTIADLVDDVSAELARYLRGERPS